MFGLSTRSSPIFRQPLSLTAGHHCHVASLAFIGGECRRGDGTMVDCPVSPCDVAAVVLDVDSEGRLGGQRRRASQQRPGMWRKQSSGYSRKGRGDEEERKGNSRGTGRGRE